MVAKNMSAYVEEGCRRPKDESSSPVLSKECVQSILTINPINPTVSGGMSPLSSSDQHVRRRRRKQLVVGSGSRIKTSVAVSSFTTNGDAGDDTGHTTTTMIASCNDGARIHVATIIEGPGESCEREVRMKYSSRSDDGNAPPYAAVCIANFDSGKPNQHNAAILALDTEGKIYAHHAEINKSDESHLFDMEICFNDDDVGNSKQKSPKRSRKISNTPKSTQQNYHPFTSMNTLTPRQELLNSANNSNPKSSSQEIPPPSTPTRKGKRKATSPSRTSDGSHTIYAVASRLNESHFLPMQFFAPPVLIRLSFDYHQGSKRSVSWTKIPGLDHVHSSLTCITFASRALCGNKLWNSIVSLMRCNESKAQTESEDDEGIVLMGCQDGSLYCTIVTNGEPCKASKLLQLNGGEPVLSLALLRTESVEPKLMCFGVLGTIAIICNSTSKNDDIDFVLKRLPFEGRWCSLATVGYNEGPSNDTQLLSIIGTTDSGKSYFCQFSIGCQQDPSETKSRKKLALQKKFRLPIAHVSCVDACPSITLRDRFQFVSYSLGGKISLMRIPSSGWNMVPRTAGSNQSLLAMLRRNGKSLQCNSPLNQRAQDTNATSKYKSVLRTLKAAIETKQESVDTQADSLDATSIHAANEVREAIRVISLSSRNAPPPINCNITASKCVQGFDLEMKNEKRHTTSSWCHSIHTITSSNSTLSPMLRPESINNMTPLCYRRTRNGLIKVLFGGSSSSLTCQNSSSVHIPVCNFDPVSVYASLSKIIKDNQLNRKPNIRFKKHANIQQGVVIPFTLGKRSSIPLSGDTVFTPSLNFAGIIRNAKDGTEARSIAEKEVQQMTQARKSVNGSEKVHCCSSSVLLASSKHIEQYHRNESHNGAPIALIFNPRQGTEICELGFALGSDDMSLLPLVRHSIIRYSRSEEKLLSDVLKNECYRALLSEKQAVKIARHVDKSACEMISRIESDSSSDDNTPTAMLTKCLSLYEILRTIQFIIG